MADRSRLPNGMTVVLEPQHAAHVVAVQVWVKVGSADEGPDEVGLAHLHEHMLFKGTARRGLGEIARTVEAHGGEINAWTSFDQTVYHVVMASQYARVGLDVLADAIRSSSFDAGELSKEIEVVCEEIKRSLDMPSRRASKDLFAAAYRTHPYGRPVIGFEEDVRRHTRDRVLGFYKAHYAPQNLVLSAVGDFEPAQLHGWVEELFGGAWGTAAPPRARPVEARFEGVRVSLVPSDVKEAHLHLAMQIPAVDHVDTPALDVLAILAGQGDASRLALEVRRKRSLANAVSCSAHTPKDPGLFALRLIAQPEHLLAAFDQSARVLAALTAVEVSPEELATVKGRIEAGAVYQRETVQGVAEKLGYYEAAAGGIEREAQYYEAISLVTPAQLREVAARYLSFERSVVTGLLPEKALVEPDKLRDVLLNASKDRPEPLPPRRLPPMTPIRLRAASRPARPGVVIEKLPSGATLVVREERAVPLLAMQATFPGGLRYEATDENGLTGLLARTWTRGTRTLDAEELSHLTDQLAGYVSAVAGRSSMTLRGEFLSKNFDRAFELFCEVLQEPAFPEADVAREQKLQLQDIAAKEDRPASVAMELFAKTLFTAHPYRMSTTGERSTVERLTPASLRRYHQRFLDPSQMTLVVVGDVDAEAVVSRARTAFSASRGLASTPPAMPTEPGWTGPRDAKKVLARAQTHLMLGFVGARVTDEFRRPLEVLSTLLSGQSGRLFIELRDKRSLAYSVSSMAVEGIDPGYFAVYMATSPEKVSTALEGMREQLRRVRDERVTEAELGRAREHLIGTHEIGLQRNGARATVMALDTCYGLGTERYLDYAKELNAITPDDVQRAAQRVIDFEKCALAVVGP